MDIVEWKMNNMVETFEHLIDEVIVHYFGMGLVIVWISNIDFDT